MNEKEILKVAAAALLFIVGSLLIVEDKISKKNATKAQSNASPSIVQKAIKKTEKIIENKSISISGEFCRNVLDNCTAQVISQREECNKYNNISIVREQLIEPLKYDDCKDIKERLGELCPDGCMLDEDALLILPGDPDIRFNEERNEEGLCETTGEVFVNVRGTCVY